MKLHRDDERGTYSAMIDVIPKTCQENETLAKVNLGLKWTDWARPILLDKLPGSTNWGVYVGEREHDAERSQSPPEKEQAEAQQTQQGGGTARDHPWSLQEIKENHKWSCQQDNRIILEEGF